MELKDYLRVIRQRWIAIVAAALIGLALAGGFTLLQTPEYQSRSELFVSVKGGSSPTDVIQGNTFAEKRVTSYVSLATSPRVLQAVADELKLTGGMNQLVGKVAATAQAQTVLIDITATDPDPSQAARIANSTARQLITAVNNVEDVTIVRLSVFEEAAPSTSPSSPRVPLNLAIGLALGLLAGIAFAVTRELFDTRLRSQADIERVVSVGILGTFSTDSSLEKAPLVTQHDKFNHRAESFRQLRTHLHFTNLSGGAQTVVVSSSIPGEGKTSTAVNLAIMLAESGAKVLLVDADLRRPRVAKYLGLEGSVGLSGVITNSVALEEAIQSWGPGGQLNVLTSGRSAPNPSELLGSSTMEKLVSRFESEYEVIIIDAPPLLPVTDPAVLGSMASGVLLVVSADGRTHRGELQQAVSDLEAVNARLLGLVVNRVEQTRGSYSYYDYRPETVESGRRGKDKGSRSRRR
ncbi:polysaccharide biosynthesis tyrosine autokinase [Arthrobacter bambusae]|uniref:non-specific protein-tyrosine kinase n=1 Tax=Arthrobacter bambusae TaxID=1338426 RepID=A0AAW8D6V3_9MICC|nr:polysaccharide biosynthesis tyrosine autokinase [Arthrobacter bambusae]MDP9904631.1 capsular exopolysaccharide synthesis family protein [Arthrobacter bambusae]MDQ0129447.1 capsular exopolysaccharide synthesis family protein [Arthrobacter bambusae]MDQ0180940.1 capsular exopolysaccharide synthesis family protein [Arthrobacter bambusae]